jgi:hypothetical protein
MPTNTSLRFDHRDFVPEWDQILGTAKRFGVSRSTIQGLLTAGKIESFLLRRDAHSRQGTRLIRQSSVREFYEKQAAEYAKAKAAGELPVVAEKGREVRMANVARRRAQKEPAKPNV